MKKLSLLYVAAFAALAIFTTSCSDDEELDDIIMTDTDSCATATYPESTGDAELDILNYSSSIITVEAQTDLTLALEVTRGESRAQKIRLFQSDCENIIGSEIDLSDQEKGGKNGIDLRATDDAQIRNVIYSVPTGFSTIYLTIEIDEAGGNFTYTQLTLNVSGSGIVDEWTSRTLGAQGNNAASRLSSSTGLTYTACNAAANIDFIDVTYAVSNTDGKSYICSNPERFESLIGLVNDVPTMICSDDEANNDNFKTSGGNATYYANSTIDFATATDSELNTIVASTDEALEVTGADQIIEFVNADGKKGLIKIESVDLGDASGSTLVSVKVQR